ncbi:MAG: hypothetical protein CMJ72_15760 [Planctomycetaceae bacterium]|nr:hypothetical protein [Planctomycetaceae bacterium]
MRDTIIYLRLMIVDSNWFPGYCLQNPRQEPLVQFSPRREPGTEDKTKVLFISKINNQQSLFINQD